MSILDQVNRIKTAVANAYTAAEAKVATLPAIKNISNLANTINTITVDPNVNCNFELYNSCRVVDTESGHVSGFLNSYSYPGYAKFKTETVDLIMAILPEPVQITLKFQPQYWTNESQNLISSTEGPQSLCYDGQRGFIINYSHQVLGPSLSFTEPFSIIYQISPAPDNYYGVAVVLNSSNNGSQQIFRQPYSYEIIQTWLSELRIGCSIDRQDYNFMGFAGQLLASDCIIERPQIPMLNPVWRGYNSLQDDS